MTLTIAEICLIFTSIYILFDALLDCIVALLDYILDKLGR